MKKITKQAFALVLLATTALAGLPAQAAESAADLEKKIQALQAQLGNLQGLQDQVRALQQQLDSMKSSGTATDNALKDAIAKEAAARAAADDAAMKAAQAAPALGVQNHNIKLTFGGFIEFAGIFRNHNEVQDINSSFGSGIVFPNSNNYDINELRFTARQSRLSILAQGDVNPDLHLTAYYEMDFLGSAGSANSQGTNSYNPRIRNIYTTIDDTADGWHLLAGQNWTLLTLNRTGVTPRTEVTPIGPEAQYVVGFNFTRNPQFRVWKDWNNEVTFAVSAESPQAVIYTPPNALQVTPVVTSNAGAGSLNNGSTFSEDPAPDVIAKLAVDPGWGHYEVFGIARWFRDQINYVSYTHSGDGVGGSVLLPLIPKELEFTGSFLVGKGLGRYGAAGFSDFTLDNVGQIHAIPYRSALFGLIGHPDPALDLYGYAGTEQVDKEAFLGTQATPVGYGYGSPLYSNAGCEVSGGTCTANTSRLYEGTVGFWYKFYRGKFGTMQAGVQEEYIKRYIFSGVGGSPNTSSNFVLFSFRYYPF